MARKPKQHIDISGADEATLRQGGDGAPAPEEETRAWLDDDGLVEVLSSLAELDAEAAAAYDAAIEAIADDDMTRILRVFRQDHLRHVRELNEVIERRGGDPVDEQLAPDQSFLGHLAGTAAILGAKSLLVAMISSEMLTNGTYLSMLELPADDDLVDLLERNYADEQRHLRWLLDVRADLGVEFPAAPEPS
jgi:rubrerythrin